MTRTFAFHVDGRARAAAILVPDDARAMAVLIHGIPASTDPDPDDPGYAGFAADLAAGGIASVWFDQRGCRSAPGDFSLGAWGEDVSAVIDALGASEERALPLVLVGSSMGGAAAIAVAGRRTDVAAVATLATPAALGYAGLLSDPSALLTEARRRGLIRDPASPRDPEAWAAELTTLAAETQIGAIAPRPVLLIHGEGDETVPYPHAERLFLAAKEPKELIRLAGVGHHLRRDPTTVDALIDWIGRRVIPDVRSVPRKDHSG